MAGQSYANHVHRPRAWLVTTVLAVVGLVLTIWLATKRLSFETVTLIILAATLVMVVWIVRLFAIH